MAHWVKNLTASAQVASEVWVQSLAWELPHAAGTARKNRDTHTHTHTHTHKYIENEIYGVTCFTYMLARYKKKAYVFASSKTGVSSMKDIVAISVKIQNMHNNLKSSFTTRNLSFVYIFPNIIFIAAIFVLNIHLERI